MLGLWEWVFYSAGFRSSQVNISVVYPWDFWLGVVYVALNRLVFDGVILLSILAAKSTKYQLPYRYGGMSSL